VLSRGDTGLVQTRVASVLAGLPATVPVKTVNRLCSSGLQAIADAAAAIQAGHYKIAIAGGFESMSSASMDNKELKPNPLTARNKDAMSCYLSMGQTSENVASKFGIPRERQDRLAVVSHARAGAAKLAGRQATEIVPVTTKVFVIDKETKKKIGEKTIKVAQDEGIRLGVTMGHLAKLPTVFKKDGSTTPGNASQLSDGAAAVILMTRGEARERGLVPMAALRSFAVAGVDPAVMGIGPVVAIPRALEKAGLAVDDIDLFELNEAFGSQADYCIEKLGLNRDIVNVMGGAIAIGHPLGMTGARLSVSIIHELHRRGGRYGVVSMCIGTGMGAAAVYEINLDDATPAAKL
jgi:acetyl-CoA acyltransferase 1